MRIMNYRFAFNYPNRQLNRAGRDLKYIKIAGKNASKSFLGVAHITRGYKLQLLKSSPPVKVEVIVFRCLTENRLREKVNL